MIRQGLATLRHRPPITVEATACRHDRRVRPPPLAASSDAGVADCRWPFTQRGDGRFLTSQAPIAAPPTLQMTSVVEGKRVGLKSWRASPNSESAQARPTAAPPPMRGDTSLSAAPNGTNSTALAKISNGRSRGDRNGIHVTRSQCGWPCNVCHGTRIKPITNATRTRRATRRRRLGRLSSTVRLTVTPVPGTMFTALQQCAPDDEDVLRIEGENCTRKLTFALVGARIEVLPWSLESFKVHPFSF